MPLRKSKSFSSKFNASPLVVASVPSFDLTPPAQNGAHTKLSSLRSRPMRALQSFLGLKSTFDLYSHSNVGSETNSISGSTTPPNVMMWRKNSPAHASTMHESPRSYRCVELPAPDAIPIINIGFGNTTADPDLGRVSTSSSTTPSLWSNTTTTDPTSVDDTNGPPLELSDSERDTGFRGLWKKVKPADKPDEGVPFDTDDAMFNPPDISANGRGSYYESTPPSAAAQSDSTNATLVAEPKKERDREGRHKDREHREHREHRDRDKDRDKDRDREHRHKDREHKEKKSSRNRIIPLEEDIRRLFQECKIGQGNASLLSQALIHAKVEELKKGERGQVMKEFRLRCLSSQELIAAQIPWATAGAERSRKEKEREKALLYGENNNDSSRTSRDKTRDRSIAQLADAAGIPGTDPPIDEQTTEEKLLAALLEANEELLGALGQYDDLERVALERQAEEKSRKEVRMDRRAIATLEQQQQFEDISAISGAGPGGSTVHLDRSRSSSPASHRASRPSSMMVQHPLPQHPHSLLTHPAQQQHLAVQYSLSNHSPEIPGTTLAPPRAPPHGPRSPASGHGHGHTRTGSSGFPPSRTPSPNTPGMDYSSSGTGTGESGGGNSTPEVVRGRELVDGINSLHVDKSRAAWAGRISMDDSSDEEILTPIKPSAKALGKRRVEVHDDMENSFHPDDLYYDQTGVLGSTDPYNPYTSEGDVPIPPTGDGGAFDYNSDSDDSESAYYPNGRPRSRNNGLLHHLHHPQVHFVYDAAAERTQQRIRDMEMENQMERSVEVGNVH